MLSHQQIRYILELEKEKNFVRASENCFVTQPTLSMQIKKAEELLGTPVFDRGRNPIELTPFGKRLLPLLREIDLAYEEVQNLVGQLNVNYKELIRIGIIPTIASYLIPAVFEEWKQRVPSIQLDIVELKTEELLVELERKNIDLAILSGPVSEEFYQITPLFQEEIKVYFPDVKKKQLRAEDLAGAHPWLLSKGNCLRTQMVHFCGLSEEKQVDQWNYQGGNIDLLLKMVQLNGGYTLVPEFHPVEDPLKASLKTLLDTATNQYPARSVIALTQKRSQKWINIEQLIRAIQLKFNTKSRKDLKVLSWK